MHEKIAKAIRNIQRGPLTTVVGVGVGLFGGYLVYLDTQKEIAESLTWQSVEVGLLLLGAALLVLPDPADDED